MEYVQISKNQNVYMMLYRNEEYIVSDYRKDLGKIIKDENRIITDGIPALYLSDKLGRKEGNASAVVLAKTTEEVSSVMKYAYENNIPVTPRGAGTNLVGSTVPDHGGIILDVSGMNKIEEFDEDTLSVTVQPGVLLKDVQAYVEERGLFYPPDLRGTRARIVQEEILLQ